MPSLLGGGPTGAYIGRLGDGAHLAPSLASTRLFRANLDAGELHTQQSFSRVARLYPSRRLPTERSIDRQGPSCRSIAKPTPESSLGESGQVLGQNRNLSPFSLQWELGNR